MNLYGAKLYVVSPYVDYFCEKKLKKIQLYDTKDWCGELMFPPIPILGRWSYQNGRNDTGNLAMVEYNAYKQDINIGEYIFHMDCSPYTVAYDLVVSKQIDHRVKDLITGFVFPEVRSSANPLSLECENKVFKVNQRIYAYIVGKLEFEEVENILNGLTEKEIEQKKQKLSYLIEETKNEWCPLPPIHERIKNSILISNFIISLKKIQEEMRLKRLEEENTKQYVKKIEPMRK